jgi:hypothetical protein
MMEILNKAKTQFYMNYCTLLYWVTNFVFKENLIEMNANKKNLSENKPNIYKRRSSYRLYSEISPWAYFRVKTVN